MHKLSDNFMNCLKSGFLAGILTAVRGDYDLDLQIRKNYINIYFKGHSLLKLTEIDPTKYNVEIHKKFANGLKLPSQLIDIETTENFLRNIPQLKQNILGVKKKSLETEYEQMIIRANNLERRNNSEYFIIDRQYMKTKARFDLIGIFWDRNNRRKNQEVDLCLMEVKFTLNQDIKNAICNQLFQILFKVTKTGKILESQGFKFIEFSFE